MQQQHQGKAEIKVKKLYWKEKIRVQANPGILTKRQYCFRVLDKQVLEQFPVFQEEKKGTQIPAVLSRL